MPGLACIVFVLLMFFCPDVVPAFSFASHPTIRSEALDQQDSNGCPDRSRPCGQSHAVRVGLDTAQCAPMYKQKKNINSRNCGALAVLPAVSFTKRHPRIRRAHGDSLTQTSRRLSAVESTTFGLSNPHNMLQLC